jgi:hypothetical protein
MTLSRLRSSSPYSMSFLKFAGFASHELNYFGLIMKLPSFRLGKVDSLLETLRVANTLPRWLSPTKISNIFSLCSAEPQEAPRDATWTAMEFESRWIEWPYGVVYIGYYTETRVPLAAQILDSKLKKVSALRLSERNEVHNGQC